MRRLAIYARDGFLCVYCGAAAEAGTALSLDHVLPREVGGGNESGNLVTACVRCNSAKQNTTMRAWFAALRARGVDTARLSKRVRRATAARADMAAGKALLRARRGAPANDNGSS